MKCAVLQKITYVSRMCKRIFRFALQLSNYWQNIKFSRYCPKFHIFIKIIIFKYICNFSGQLLHPYKFHDRDMSEILFFIFASCEPLRYGEIVRWGEGFALMTVSGWNLIRCINHLAFNRDIARILIWPL